MTRTCQVEKLLVATALLEGDYETAEKIVGEMYDAAARLMATIDAHRERYAHLMGEDK